MGPSCAHERAYSGSQSTLGLGAAQVSRRPPRSHFRPSSASRPSQGLWWRMLPLWWLSRVLWKLLASNSSTKMAEAQVCDCAIVSGQNSPNRGPQSAALDWSRLWCGSN